MQEQKWTFIKKNAFLLLKRINNDTQPLWGKMNAQQMVEHLSSFFDVSSGRLKFDLVTPVEHLPKYKEFLYSDKKFRENTKAPVNIIGEEPLPIQFKSFQEAVEKLQESVDHFEKYFKENPHKTILHPVFGPLNFNEWVLLHYKHVTHHLNQFGV